ncbi:ankyrin repeat-containing domain protein [Aspergillus venezuelensis]
MAKILLEKGQEWDRNQGQGSSGINLTDHKGRTALYRAVEEAFDEGVALLLAQPNIDPNIAATGDMDRTPLIRAINPRLTSIAERLIKHDGTYFDLVDNAGYTTLMQAASCPALHVACVKNHARIVDTLLATGVPQELEESEDQEEKDRCGTPLHWAAEAGALDALKCVLEWDDYDVDLIGCAHDEGCRLLLSK